MCVRGKGKRVVGVGGRGCDPTATRPASQAGETQAHVGAPLTRQGHELVVEPARADKPDVDFGLSFSFNAITKYTTVLYLTLYPARAHVAHTPTAQSLDSYSLTQPFQSTSANLGYSPRKRNFTQARIYPAFSEFEEAHNPQGSV